MSSRSRSQRGEGRSERLFRACLRLYPRAFRREYGAAMAETFSARRRDTGPGIVGRVWFLLRECSTAVLGGLGLRIAYALGRGGRGRAGAGASRIGQMPMRNPSWLVRGRDFVPNLARDLGSGARALTRRPGVTASAILALGMGIGLATTIFSVVYSAVYRPLPVPEGDRILHLEWANPSQGRRELAVGYHDFLDWKAQQTVFQDLGAFYRGTVNLSGENTRPERYFGGFITANAWEVLGIRPLLGRGFLSGENQPGAPPVVILAYSVWQSRYDGNPEVVGKTIRVNGVPTTVVGVMPEGFAFPYWEDVWVPLTIDPLTVERGKGPGLEVFGRLAEGRSLEEARTELDAISARLAITYPATNEGLVAVMEPYIDSYHGDDSKLAATLFVGFGLAVLLIACFNVANLLLAQAVTQTRDLAVRVAMGASHWRVVTRVLQQALLMAAAGAVLGTLLAIAGVGLLDRWITGAATYPLPFWMKLTVDGPVLGFVLSAVAMSVLASGLIPALRSCGTDVHATLTDASRGNSSLRIGRMSRLLVLAQITGTTLLLVLAGHLALDLGETRRAQHGFPTANVLSARVGLFEGVFPEREQRQGFYRELVRRLQETPGVLAAALGTSLPGTTASREEVAVQGQDYGQQTGLPVARVAYVSPEYFDAFQAPVVEGRAFTSADDAHSAPVALVNRSYMARFFPDEDPLGWRIQVRGADPEGTWRTVVGVVPDLAMDGAMRPEGDPEGVYLPIAQSDVRFVSIAVRTRGDPLAFAPTLRDEVMALQMDTPVYFVQTLQDSININLLDAFLVGSLLWALALAAFLLASVGLYGLTSFLANQRTRELGVRIALGAKRDDILRLVTRGGAGQVILGLAVGLLLAAGCMALMDSGEMETTPWSYAVAGIVCVILGGTGLTAILVPAWRATRVDPVEALRAE